MNCVLALVGEVVNQYVPFAGIAIETALGRYIMQQQKKAADRLLDEFRKGRIDRISWASEDEFAGMLLRYLNAVRDSAGLEALRLMAKVMVGQIQRDSIYASEFTRYANMLASLSRDEILAITYLHQARLASKAPENTEGVWKEMMGTVVPTHFPSEQYVHAVLTAASRSGLVITPHDLFAVGVYTTSPLMDEISQLADFQDALHCESPELRPSAPDPT